jgi:general stress protein YciG
MTILGHHQPRPRGFASMDERKQREIASRGGRAAHAQGTAHKFSPEEARAAGRKGGERVSGNREYMASIGRRGGEARHARRLARASAQGATTTQPQGDSPQANKNVEKDGTNDDSSHQGNGSSNPNVEPSESSETP